MIVDSVQFSLMVDSIQFSQTIDQAGYSQTITSDTPPLTGPFGATTTWPVIPFPALVGGVTVALIASFILFSAARFDRETKGFLTISILIVLAFIIASFASMIYTVPLNPITEILVGALSTALGAIISQWVGRARVTHREEDMAAAVEADRRLHPHD